MEAGTALAGLLEDYLTIADDGFVQLRQEADTEQVGMGQPRRCDGSFDIRGEDARANEDLCKGNGCDV